MAQEILVESLRTDGLQIRPALDLKFVTNELVPVLKEGRKFSHPLTVYKDAAGIYWVADGHHRLRAHEEAQKRTALCDIIKGEFIDAFRHALGANSDHGQRRSDDTIKNAILKAFEARAQLWPGIKDMPSATLIAQTVKCSDTWVKRQLVTVTSWNEAQTRTGADGKTRTMPRPPWVARAEAAAATPVTPTPAVPAAKPTPPVTARKPTPAPSAAEPGRVDAVGQPIPDHLEPLFDRAADITGLLGMLSNVRGAVKAGADDPLWSECDRQAAEAGIAQAYDAIKATAPYAVCPWCHGKAPMLRGCRGCGGRGAVGRFRWDTAVPGEMKP